MKLIALLPLLAFAPLPAQDDRPKPATPQHEWLHAWLGEWTVEAEATMSPGADPIVMESDWSFRPIGGNWVVGECSATYLGAPFEAILTLGYDPARKAYVGSWVDSMQTNMWTYEGVLDASGKKLTMNTEGPGLDPSSVRPYRDVYEVTGKDTRRLTSSIQGEDGSWTTFMTASYRRKE